MTKYVKHFSEIAEKNLEFCVLLFFHNNLLDDTKGLWISMATVYENLCGNYPTHTVAT
jgi:hypothetical protein